MKEQYKRQEDEMFTAAKKFIGQLSKKYNNSYVDKRLLFVNTWKQVCNAIQVRQDIQNYHMDAPVRAVVTMLVGSTSNIKPVLTDWIVKHVEMKYNYNLNDAEQTMITKKLHAVTEYAASQNIMDSLNDIISAWKCNVVNYIRSEYGYEYICKHNLPYEKLSDVVDDNDLEIILHDRSLFGISSEQAMHIIDLVAKIISDVVPAQHMIKI